jgi:hypothetical protein
VTVGTQLGRRLEQDELGLAVTVGGVASEAVGDVLGVHPVRFGLVTHSAAPANLVRGRVPETEQQAFVAAAVQMIAAGPVASLAAAALRRALIRQLAMGGIGDFAADILMTCQAGIAAYVLRRLSLRMEQRPEQSECPQHATEKDQMWVSHIFLSDTIGTQFRGSSERIAPYADCVRLL